MASGGSDTPVSRLDDRNTMDSVDYVKDDLEQLKRRYDTEREELVQKREALLKRQALARERQQLEQKEEQLDIETAISVASAKTSVITIEDNPSYNLNDQEPINSYETPFPRPSGSAYIPHSTASSRNATRDFAPDASYYEPEFYSFQLLQHLKRPNLDVKKFGGNASDFPRFLRQFRTQVLSYTSSNDERMNYLEQYTYGQPNKIVTGYGNMPADMGFPAAMRDLEDRYGNPDIIANDYIDRALKWKDIRADKPRDLDDFGIFLFECQTAVRNLNALRIIEYPHNIQTLLKKLPFYMHDKWRSYISNIQVYRVVQFSDFVDFVKSESRKQLDPIYGKEVLGLRSNIGNNQPSKSNQRTFTGQINCEFCNKAGHCFQDCLSLEKLEQSEKLKFLKGLKLCFACLERGHMSPVCTNRLVCKKCSRYHPTILHIDVSRPNTSLSVTPLLRNPTRAGFYCSVKMPVIPVKVKGNNSLIVVETYAFMDPGSSICFIADFLLKALGINTIKFDLRLETMHGVRSIPSSVVKNISVYKYDMSDSICIPTCYSKDIIPVDKSSIPSKNDIKMWTHLSGIDILEIDSEIGLLIGSNIAEAYTPLDFRVGPKNAPYASRTSLEKTINDKQEYSRLDNLFLEKVENSVTFKDGHYYVSLPLKDDSIVLPDNYSLVFNRLLSLKRKLLSDSNFYNDYVAFMSSLLVNGYAEEVPLDQVDNPDISKWFLPHHGVYHRQKKKLRTVFDCSAKCCGVSLNSVLLGGPDLTGNLLIQLLKFRFHRIGLTSDLESMFLQVRVPEQDRNMLRFLWWPDGNLSLPVKQYRMTAHLFGAVSSPSIANYALRRTATDNVDNFKPDVIKAALDDFYVDDCLLSVDSEMSAINLVTELTKLCKNGGFRLHKWISNSPQVLSTIPESERGINTDCFIGAIDNDMVERALGVSWNVPSDMLTFKINVQRKPQTRRGLLSIISAVFDPLGLAAPAILPAKIILQELCTKGYTWDQEIQEPLLSKWNRWISDLPLLENLIIPRCIKPEHFSNIVLTQLHYFADASDNGYGVAVYLRLIDTIGNISCNLILGKARVAPLKRQTIPRMELTAATVAVKLSSKIMDGIRLHVDQTFFWTDSTTVLGYIANSTTRYQTFVANRIALISESTELGQWHYIPSELNPADDASRGLNITTLLNRQIWFKGPSFLLKPESEWPKFPLNTLLSENDPEIKKTVYLVDKVDHPLDILIDYYSDYDKLVRAVALLRLCIKRFHSKVILKKSLSELLSVEDISSAETLIIRHEQCKHFNIVLNPETDASDNIHKIQQLRKLDPIISKGLLRVGGRIQNVKLTFNSKHQLIIPKLSRLSELLVRRAHVQVGHLGKNSVLSKLRETYWIIGVSGTIKSLLSRCVICRRYKAQKLQQKMAELPVERLNPFTAPFHHTGMDYFGPFDLLHKRSTVKRYGVIFTCLSSKAVHLEVAYSLDTDSCINAIRRFVSRRGKPYSIRSDNGSNLVSASTELKKGISEINTSKLNSTLIQNGIHWYFNPPAASHFGGAWERLIRQVRKVLNSLQRDQLSRMNDEGFITLMCEVESILNKRPLTRVSESPDDLDFLTPNHLLGIGINNEYSITVPDKSDNYIKKRWKQVQYLSDIFWKRWLNEYVPSLQERQKWLNLKRNVMEGDIVLLVESNMRNSWNLGRVLETFKDKHGLVRSVLVKTKSVTLKRPIHKLCMILEAENV